TLQYLGDRKQAAVLHLLAVLFEPILPVRVTAAAALSEEIDHARDLTVARHLAQAQILNMRERDHYRQAVVGEPQEVEPLEVSRKSTAADVLNRRDPVVGVHDLFTNVEGHAKIHSRAVRRCLLVKSGENDTRWGRRSGMWRTRI